MPVSRANSESPITEASLDWCQVADFIHTDPSVSMNSVEFTPSRVRGTLALFLPTFRSIIFQRTIIIYKLYWIISEIGLYFLVHVSKTSPFVFRIYRFSVKYSQPYTITTSNTAIAYHCLNVHFLIIIFLELLLIYSNRKSVSLAQ
jgi:hypothetical protein